MKFPNVIAGSLAASAPIWQFPGLAPCDSYNKGVTHDFEVADKTGKCAESIRRSWKEIDTIGQKEGGELSWRWYNYIVKDCVHQVSFTQQIATLIQFFFRPGLQWLTSAFRLCAPLSSTDELKSWLAETWGDVAMVDYPYPANFLEPLPEWPIRHICQHLSNDWRGEKLMYGLRHAALVYYNHTGESKGR